MENKNTDIFNIVDNFAATKHIRSIPVFEAQLKIAPKVTIAIPTLNRAYLLKEAVDSAVNQVAYKDYDIIVVDNNPERNDETEKLMWTYSDFPHISYYKNAENLQMDGNWNRLYVLAKGEYVVMLHDDDLLYPNYLSSLFSIIEKTDYDAYFTQKYFYDTRLRSDPPIQTKGYVKCLPVKTSDFMYGYITGAPTGMCAKKEAILNTGGFDSTYYPSHDYSFTVKFSYHYKICLIIGCPLLIYRIAENESMKAETILNFINCDRAIKRGIIAKKNTLVKKIWNSHMNIYAYKYLAWESRRFHTNIKVRETLEKMDIEYSIKDVLIYKSINKFRSLRNKISKLFLHLMRI
jgi:glycosyltransferase involved in cell wall biosynthesis